MTGPHRDRPSRSVSSAEAFLYGVSPPATPGSGRPRSGQAARHLHAAGGARVALGPHHHPAGQARRVLRAQGDVHAAGRAAAGGRHHACRPPPAPPSGSGSRRSPPRPSARAATPSSTRSASCRRTSTPSAAGGPPTKGTPIDASISVDFLDEGPLTTSSPVDALRTFTRSWRFQQCFARQLFRFYTGRDETAGDDPVLRQMFFDFATTATQDIVGMLRTLASAATFSRRAEVP